MEEFPVSLNRGQKLQRVCTEEVLYNSFSSDDIKLIEHARTFYESEYEAKRHTKKDLFRQEGLVYADIIYGGTSLALAAVKKMSSIMGRTVLIQSSSGAEFKTVADRLYAAVSQCPFIHDVIVIEAGANEIKNKIARARFEEIPDRMTALFTEMSSQLCEFKNRIGKYCHKLCFVGIIHQNDPRHRNTDKVEAINRNIDEFNRLMQSFANQIHVQFINMRKFEIEYLKPTDGIHQAIDENNWDDSGRVLYLNIIRKKISKIVSKSANKV